jgi:secreted trypsin-like serine protease
MGQRRRVKIPVHLDPKGALAYGDGVHDTCYADSGGPAFLGNQLVGITSNGAERCGGGGVDARVDQHLDFIDQKQTACNQE